MWILHFPYGRERTPDSSGPSDGGTEGHRWFQRGRRSSPTTVARIAVMRIGKPTVDRTSDTEDSIGYLPSTLSVIFPLARSDRSANFFASSSLRPRLLPMA